MDEYKNDFHEEYTSEQDKVFFQPTEIKNQQLSSSINEEKLASVQSNTSNLIEEPQKEEEHLMRLSIDVHSVKDLRNPSYLSVQWKLHLKNEFNFKSYPPTSIPKGKETKLTNTFNSIEFPMNKSELFVLLNSTNCEIEFLNSGRNSSVVLLGAAFFPLNHLLRAELKQTPHSMVRVYDGYFGIEEKNQNNDIIGRAGQARIIIYLEDLGIIDSSYRAAKENMNVINSTVAPPTKVTKVKEEISRNEPNESIQQKEYEVIWQLEIWKKAEEAKFKAYLKEKELETINGITNEWKNKEIEREKQMQTILNGFKIKEENIKKKVNELKNRESKIKGIEEELRGKIQDVTKQLTNKEEEIIFIKNKFRNEKLDLEKEKKSQASIISSLKEQLSEQEEKYRILKNEYENSSINTLRQEICNKGLKITELEKEIEFSNKSKEQYKLQYEKIKNELIRVRKQQDYDKDLTLKQKDEELEKMRLQLNINKISEEEQRELKQIKAQINEMQTKAGTYNQIVPIPVNNSRSFEKFEKFEKNEKFEKGSNIFLRNMEIMENRQKSPPQRNSVALKSEFERLIEERNELIHQCHYSENDPVILHLNERIEECRKLKL